MIVQNILLAEESYTHDNWVYRDVFVGFSRLYYIIDGEGYYEENGQTIRLKKGHIYITPVKKPFTLYDNPNDKLLHTYCHIITLPMVDRLTEIEVPDASPLADAVALWRKYIHTEDTALLINIIQFLLSLCVDKRHDSETELTKKLKGYLDSQKSFSLDMAQMSRSLGYSREHLTRSFLSVYHITPKQYLNQRKMNVALEKLVDGARVNEVADYLRYSSPYSFSKAFKKYFGTSPKKYLQALNKK